ncbi:hypothetical protein PQR75_26290 [Paraburkholderia fungorum]|uniref:hypothetical protein n=1 Tax=Paraburkholderia fungorum TaxID=134537 RepID=UPI0038B953D8
MQQMHQSMAHDSGWVTNRKKDGSQTLREPFYSTNPMYVAQHKEWDWQQCDAALAELEVSRAMGLLHRTWSTHQK